MKFCSKCKLEKKFTDFCKDSSKEDGLRTTCKVCKSQSDKNYVTKNVSKIAVRRKQNYLKNYDKERKQVLPADINYSKGNRA